MVIYLWTGPKAQTSCSHARIERGGRGSGPQPPENHNNIGFLSHTGTNSMENHKATKPTFKVGPPSARQRNKFEIKHLVRRTSRKRDSTVCLSCCHNRVKLNIDMLSKKVNSCTSVQYIFYNSISEWKLYWLVRDWIDSCFARWY